MTFYMRLAFTSGLALRIKGAAYFTKSQLSETDNRELNCRLWLGALGIRGLQLELPARAPGFHLQRLHLPARGADTL
jgi:hypothetical protein